MGLPTPKEPPVQLTVKTKGKSKLKSDEKKIWQSIVRDGRVQIQGYMDNGYDMINCRFDSNANEFIILLCREAEKVDGSKNWKHSTQITMSMKGEIKKVKYLKPDETS